MRVSDVFPTFLPLFPKYMDLYTEHNTDSVMYYLYIYIYIYVGM